MSIDEDYKKGFSDGIAFANLNEEIRMLGKRKHGLITGISARDDRTSELDEALAILSAIVLWIIAVVLIVKEML